MIKFEKDNYITFFEDEDAAAKWLVEQFDKGGRFEDLLADIYYTFSGWINDNYTAYDILRKPQCFNYDELYNEWFYELAYEIYHNELDYFTNEDKEE